MTEKGGPSPPLNGEIIPQDDSLNGGGGEVDSVLNQTLIALVSNYTDRPDLLIGEIEKHDPGFVKRMNAAAEANAEEQRAARFKFGKRQAYTGLIVSVVAALVVLAGFILAIWFESGLSVILGIVAMYAVTQGGPGGFARMIEVISGYFTKDKADPKDDEK